MTRTRITEEIRFLKMFWASEAEDVVVGLILGPNRTVDPWADFDLFLFSSFVNIALQAGPLKVKPVKFIWGVFLKIFI